MVSAILHPAKQDNPRLNDSVGQVCVISVHVFFFNSLALLFLGLINNAKYEIGILCFTMRYFVKTPWWLKKIYRHRLWQVATKEKLIYLTFDDGPHPVVTPFVLDELKKYHAKATFFCIGKNVVDYPVLYNRIIEEGHQVGNHTQHHLNGWKTNNETYLSDVALATQYIDSNLFRPPYGRLKSKQSKGICVAMKNKLAKIVMWDVLSGDFDESLSGEQCLNNVIHHSSSGSIVVFHDSEKAFSRLQYTLPKTLDFFSSRGYSFRELEK